MKTSQLLELIMRTLPYPDQIRNLQIEDEAVRFEWRSQRFRISTTLLVETVGNGVLIGDDISIIFGKMLNVAHVSEFMATLTVTA